METEIGESHIQFGPASPPSPPQKKQHKVSYFLKRVIKGVITRSSVARMKFQQYLILQYIKIMRLLIEYVVWKITDFQILLHNGNVLDSTVFTVCTVFTWYPGSQQGGLKFHCD